MFDSPLPYRFVQRSKRLNTAGSHQFEYIYKFFISDLQRRSRRKIIVQVKQFSTTHFTVDFYATTSNKDKVTRNLNASPYRYQTKVGRANRIAATVFAIIRSLRHEFADLSFAFQGASSFFEADNRNSRRYQVYRQIMELVTATPNNPWQAFGYPEDSYIFVIQKRFLPQKALILTEYGRIFNKTFEGPPEESSQDKSSRDQTG